MGGYTLGLDIGSKSVGWALVDKGRKASIIGMGVRVFPEGVDRDTKGLEKSKSAACREARGARRMHQRRNLRREQLLRTLLAEGLLPAGGSELRSIFNRSPYELRRRGLDERLEPYEFGRVLYHLSQRRGFKSNRKSADLKEDGKVKKEAGELRGQTEAAGCRTIGEYFAGLDPEQQRIRGRYTFRSMYEKEFDLLWGKQREFYPEVLTDDLRKRIRDEIIFFQRPLKPTDEFIGQCELEPEEKRCPRGDWYARRFRILQDVNNLKVLDPDGSEDKVGGQERQLILDELSKKKELKFDDIRKKLGLVETQSFNLEQDGKVKALKGDAFAYAMRSRNVFGAKVWDGMDEQKKLELNDAVVELEDDDLVEEVKREYGFNDEQVEAVLKISLPRGYMSFSRKAILKLLPFMEEGCITSEAIAKTGYSRDEGAKGAVMERLPLPSDLRNPIVQKALFEVRKVVNAIVREYGKPVGIIIEMARDVHGSRRQREELHWKILENQKRNDEVRKRLKEDMGIANPTREDVIKYKLWEECGRICPYTGKPIPQEALFGPNPEFQVEHILPYDRSLDDSFMNKTLCEGHENIHVKRGQTPFEAYGHEGPKYEQIQQRIKVLPWAKRQKFLQKEIDVEKHISRELNDTRYICRETVRYLKQLGVHVRGSRGRITNELRHQWGLDGIFDELGTRRDDDHRRHAVDAVVVGVTDNEHLRRLAQSKYSGTGERFDPPWANFREEVRERVRHIDVSHRVQRKVSGQLHEETSYGSTDKKDEKGQELFVYRKKLEDLTLPMVDKIVDPVVREIVKGRLAEKGVDVDGRDRKIPKEVWKEPLYMKNTRSSRRVRIKKVRVADVFSNMIPMSDKAGQPYRYVAPGSNHHIEIFEFTDEKGRVRRDGKVVTMFEAVRRSQRGEPVVGREHGAGRKFICSLGINEMFMVELDKGLTELHRVQKISGNKQIFLRHHTFGGDLQKEKGISRYPNSLKGHKVTVDPLGRVLPAND
ncbi:MAG TPA: type II CRISPR RNA-guided endonuclease Cas9 [Sedimentisphaerales bacterium]|nr:type II CRISPR RNA-guided endonuclease Cas9 [Sedimentisphaerales bacterium]